MRSVYRDIYFDQARITEEQALDIARLDNPSLQVETGFRINAADELIELSRVLLATKRGYRYEDRSKDAEAVAEALRIVAARLFDKISAHSSISESMRDDGRRTVTFTVTCIEDTPSQPSRRRRYFAGRPSPK